MSLTLIRLLARCEHLARIDGQEPTHLVLPRLKRPGAFLTWTGKASGPYRVKAYAASVARFLNERDNGGGEVEWEVVSASDYEPTDGPLPAHRRYATFHTGSHL